MLSGSNKKETQKSLFQLRFAILASRMEQYTQSQSRDLIDQAYTKIVRLFNTLDLCNSHFLYFRFV